MREFKIYYSGKGKSCLHFSDFVRSIEREINNDEEILISSQVLNRKFSEDVREILSNPENDIFSASMINGLKETSGRYIYLKDRQFNKKNYDVEIDLLLRRFSLFEV